MKENNRIIIGDVLKETRKSLRIYTRRNRGELGLAPRYLSDIERNKSKGSIDTLVKLCNLYKITPTFVLQNYLEVSEDYKIQPEMMGYNKLNNYDKNIVSELIKIMNKKS